MLNSCRINVLRYAQAAMANGNQGLRLLSVSGQDFSDEYNAAVLLAIGQGALTVSTTDRGVMIHLSDFGAQELYYWQQAQEHESHRIANGRA